MLVLFFGYSHKNGSIRDVFWTINFVANKNTSAIWSQDLLLTYILQNKLLLILYEDWKAFPSFTINILCYHLSPILVTLTYNYTLQINMPNLSCMQTFHHRQLKRVSYFQFNFQAKWIQRWLKEIHHVLTFHYFKEMLSF